jgi:hypothetical protein
MRLTRSLQDLPFTRLAPLAQLALRVALAVPFFRSGLTKWDSFGKLSDSAVYLFREEFKLHIFGSEIAYPAAGGTPVRHRGDHAADTAGDWPGHEMGGPGIAGDDRHHPAHRA